MESLMHGEFVLETKVHFIMKIWIRYAELDVMSRKKKVLYRD